MRQKSPLFSLPGIILLALLLAGLGLALWRRGGMAFSPGSLSAQNKAGVEMNGFASHADFEKDCHYCHQPLNGRQAELCLTCHTTVSTQIVSASGLHAALPNVKRCAVCHSDHHGKEFNPSKDALGKFDHSITSFNLVKHQVDYSLAPMDCQACHLDNANYSFSIQGCTDCHSEKDASFIAQHLKDFGGSCLDCHDGKDRMIGFDHASTVFPLTGKHAEVNCADCHQKGNFSSLGTECAACHAEPAAHSGVFPSDCETCHNTDNWKPALLDGQPFDHLNQSGFSLAHHWQDFAAQPITCKTCHADNLKNFDQAICVSCHLGGERSFLKKHMSRFGTDCVQCHDGVDRMTNFDHATVFPLDGRHAQIDCAACHVDNAFRGIPKECSGCHAEPAIHAGFFGLRCEACHTTEQWHPGQLRIHDFPLDHGGGGEVDCKVCHVSTYTEYTCYGCHDHQQDEITASHQKTGIPAEKLPQCDQCHRDGTVTKG